MEFADCLRQCQSLKSYIDGGYNQTQDFSKKALLPFHEM